MRYVFARFGLFLTVLLVLTLFLEIFLRIFPSSVDAIVIDLAWNESPAGFYENFPWEHKPNQNEAQHSYIRHRANSTGHFRSLEYDVNLRSNSLGFRGAEPKDLPRVLLLGDSFVFGAQVEEEHSFAAIVNDRLAQFSVLNAGVDGYGTYEALKLLKYHQNLLTFEEVTLFFYWGNDLYDNKAFVMGAPIMDQSKSSISLAPAKYSRVYGRIFYWLDGERYKQPSRSDLEINNSSELFLDILNHSKIALEEYGQHCTDQHIRCSMVLIPPKEAFSMTHRGLKIRQAIAAITPSNIRIEDALDVLDSNGGAELYYRFDPHFNEHGHRVVADFLLENLF